MRGYNGHMSSTLTPTPSPSYPESQEARRRRTPGGTPGGMGSFLAGLALAVAGGYLITTHVRVASFPYRFFGWNFYGTQSFGLTMLPLLVGIGMLFFNGKSVLGWLISAAGVVFIVLHVLMSLQVYWQDTSLFATVMMWGMFAAGLGMILRSLRASSGNW